MRHAKSSWDHPGLADHDRPLNKRGQRAAQQMGAWLAQQGLSPPVVLASTAVRVQETLERLVPELAAVPEIITLECLYPGSPLELLRSIGQIHNDHAAVLVLGHNPAMETLVGTIGKQSVHFPTAAVAQVLADNAAWALADEQPAEFLQHCHLQEIWRPKHLFPEP